MFNMTPETFRANLHTNTRFVVEASRRVMDAQLAAFKQGEKMTVDGMEMSRKSMESAMELQKATWSAWLDMLAPKAEAK